MWRIIVVLACLFCVSSANGQGITYSRTVPAGSFQVPTLWTPFSCCVPPVMLGPGGATDNARFDLGQNFANLYTITAVFGINNRLVIENDSLRLQISDYETVSNLGASSSSVVIGRDAGDTAIAIFSATAPNSEFRSVSSVIGSATGALGSVFVSGNDFTWDNSGSVRVGNAGTGNLIVLLGGRMESGSLRIGNHPGSMGSVIVDGPESSLFPAAVFAGREGGGLLCVTNGGFVNGGDGVVGDTAGSLGHAIIEQDGTWHTGDLRIGFEGLGFLDIQSGGFVGCFVGCIDGVIGGMPGSNGFASIGSGSEWLMTDDLSIGGDVDFGFGNGGGGDLNINFGGTVVVMDEIFLFPDGRLHLDGTLTADAVHFVDGGEFEFHFGTLHVGVFNGNLVNEAGRLAPGNVATGSTFINGNYTQQDNGILEIEIGGSAVSTGYDFVNVTGTAFLDGTLQLDLINGFVPTPGQAFTILNVSPGTLIGFFDNVGDNQRLDTVGGEGSFLVRYGVTSPNPTQIILSDFQTPIVLGDVNGDGVVNLLDVAPFVAVLTSGIYNPAADINMDGQVNLLDVALFVALLTS